MSPGPSPPRRSLRQRYPAWGVNKRAAAPFSARRHQRQLERAARLSFNPDRRQQRDSFAPADDGDDNNQSNDRDRPTIPEPPSSAQPPSPVEPEPPSPAQICVRHRTLGDAGITLSVQTCPRKAPVPLEIYISPDHLLEHHDDHAGDDNDAAKFCSRIRLYSSAAIHHPLKRRSLHDSVVDQPPPKRRHTEPSVQSRDPLANLHLPCAPPRRHDVEELDEELDDTQHSPAPRRPSLTIASSPRRRSTHRERRQSRLSNPPADAYVVDLGVVRVYPAAQQVVRPDTDGDDSARHQSLSPVDPELSPPNTSLPRHVSPDPDGVSVARYPTRTAVQSAAKTATLIVLALLCALRFIVPVISALDMLFYSPQLSQLPESPLQPVDWFREATELEMAVCSVSRIILFGEVSQEARRWQSQPGLRPVNGPLHGFRVENDTSDDIVMPEPAFDSPFAPRYKPWETASNGLYIPEPYFFLDLVTVVDTIVNDVQEIADHGPLAFRFTQGSSTQFRWSTSANKFLPPHASLPTLPYNQTDYATPGSTVYGLPPATSGHHPDPTARPREVNDIYNLDPPLTELCQRLTHHLIYARLANILRIDDLIHRFPDESLARAAFISLRLSHLRGLRQDGNGTWGSDQQRLDCMYPRPTFDLGAPVTRVTRPLPSDVTRVPSGIPPEYLERVFEAHHTRTLRSRSFDASVSSASSTSTGSPATTCHPSQWPTPALWSRDQIENRTAHDLVDIIGIIVNHDLLEEGEPMDRNLFRLVEYEGDLAQLCQHLDQLNERVQQVLQATHSSTSTSSSPEWSRTQSSVKRLQDASQFLSEVATVRICEMSHRLKRGVALLEETELRLHRLRSEIQRHISAGWVGPPIDVRRSGKQPSLIHFPDLDSMIAEWQKVTKWAQDEGSRVEEAYSAQSFWFRQLRKQEDQDKEFKSRPIIFSRWSMRDARMDPFGAESFCWDGGPVEGNATKKLKGCGDAALRHGKQ
ncbi:hypothetical protein FDECE_8838 [Fusarium decemcellulare]|nr:hypothetical protein FDECE_8838 [Fusarium decemcellulare]